jgi:hypothetical protein
MEVFMLEDYYVKPSTIDRVRSSWPAPQNAVAKEFVVKRGKKANAKPDGTKKTAV